MWDKPLDNQLVELQNRVTQLEAQLNHMLGVVALSRPAETALTRCGVSQEQQQAFYDLIDDMSMRVESGCSVSYADFEERVADLVPSRRGDRRFFEALIEALKLERPAAKSMLDYLTHAMALFRV